MGMINLNSVQCVHAIRLINHLRSASSDSEPMKALYGLFSLKPDWMASVFCAIKKRLKEIQIPNVFIRDMLNEVGYFENIHKKYHYMLSKFGYPRSIELNHDSFAIWVNHTANASKRYGANFRGSALIESKFRPIWTKMLIEIIQAKVKIF